MMVLPSLPAPPVCRSQSECIAWLGVAYSTVVDIIRAAVQDGVYIHPDARCRLDALREWLYYNYHTERVKRRDRRRKEVCHARAWFCFKKYDHVRRSLFHDVTLNTISVVPPQSVQQGPFTSL